MSGVIVNEIEAMIAPTFKELKEKTGKNRFKVHQPNCGCLNIPKLNTCCLVAVGNQNKPTTRNNILWVHPFKNGKSFFDKEHSNIEDSEINFAKCGLMGKGQRNGFFFFMGPEEVISQVADFGNTELKEHPQAKMEEDEAEALHCIPVVWLYEAIKNTKNSDVYSRLRSLFQTDKKLKFHGHINSVIKRAVYSSEDEWCLVFSWSDDKYMYIDIPGGKRNFLDSSGNTENSLRCAIRETEEECRLKVDIKKKHKYYIFSEHSKDFANGKLFDSVIDDKMLTITFIIKCFADINKISDSFEVKSVGLSDKISKRPSTPIPDAFNSIGLFPEGLSFNPEEMVSDLLKGS